MARLKERPEWLAAFARWMKGRGYRSHSIHCYLSRLASADRFLRIHESEPIELADPDTAKRYLAWIQARRGRLGEASRQSIASAIACWVKYARQVDLLPPVPCQDPEQRPFRTRPWLESYAQWMKGLGYRRAVIVCDLGRLGRIGGFLLSRGLEPHHLAEAETVDNYLAHQPGRPRSGVARIRLAVRRWLTWARAVGQVPPLPPPPPDAPEVAAYLRFCREHQGLSASSVREYGQFLRQLNRYLSEQGAELVGAPLPLLDRFVAEQGQSRGGVARAAAALRGFCRYLFLIGREPEDRSGWIDAPRLYRNERLPRHLSDAQLEEGLARVDRSTRSGKRNWAVLTLLTSYGLRIGEVNGLELEDIDWEARRVRVVRSKTRSESVYPLTPAVEEALRAYLEVRPDTACTRLFVTFHAPHRPHPSGSILGGLSVRRYLQRGPHTLRHTLARRLREGGAPLGLMRRILGHQSSNSTGRYLRIALEELREVATNYADLL